MNKINHIGIIGAGIAGLSVAYMLSKKGFQISVYESAEKINGIGAGIGLASNAIKAFDYLGLADEIEKISNPLADFQVFTPSEKLLFSIDTKRIAQTFGKSNYSIHRADLHQFLLNQNREAEIFTGKRLMDIEPTDDKVILRFEDQTQVEVDFVIGADGVNSRVRQILIPEAKPKYAGYWCWRGVVNFAKKDYQRSMAFWGKPGRFGITPLDENTIYWFACINSKIDGATSKYGLNELKQHFKDYPELVQQLLNISTDEKLIRGPVMDINPLPEFVFSKAILIGDAAHAATPNMGQGACMAVEDVAVLQDELIQNDFLQACKNFEKRRLNRTQYIIKNSRCAGKVAQLQHPILTGLRNLAFSILPDKITQFPVRRLYEEDFMES